MLTNVDRSFILLKIEKVRPSLLFVIKQNNFSDIHSLPSFDGNVYAANSNSNVRTWESLSEEFLNVRGSSEDLFGSFSETMLQQKGLANNNNVSVLSLGFYYCRACSSHQSCK